MVRNILIICLVAFSEIGISQKDTILSRILPIKFNATLAQGFMIYNKTQNVYLDASAEYYTQQNVSIGTNLLNYIDSRGSSPSLKSSQTFLIGTFYHIVNHSHDISIGIQPGLSYLLPTYNIPLETNISQITIPTHYKSRINPVFSIGAGYSYSFSKYCNFFINGRYLISRFRWNNLKFDEIMIMGGLGFQIPQIKKR